MGAIRAQKTPYGFAAETGPEHRWRPCGRSRPRPLCEHSRRGNGLTPVRSTVAEGKRVWLRGRKAIGGKPPCDGWRNPL